MGLSGRDEYDIPFGHGVFFFFSGDDSFPGNDDEDLLAVVGMKLVPNRLAEVYHGYLQITDIGRKSLPGHIGPREDGMDKRLGRRLVD